MLNYKILIFISLIILLIILFKKRNEYFNDNIRVVISLTTSPKRLEKIDNILNIIVKQTRKPSKIILNVPYIFKRDGTQYNQDILNNLSNKYGEILLINRCEDRGPITKLLPTLDLEKNPNTYIILIDDDIIYEKDLIEKLINEYKRNPEIIIANNIFTPLKDTTIPQAFAGIIFKRSIFDDSFNKFADEVKHYKHCYNSDDLILGLYFIKKNIKIKLPEKSTKYQDTDYGQDSDALKNQDNMNHYERYEKCKKFIDTML
jgi:hypothetical protein